MDLQFSISFYLVGHFYCAQSDRMYARCTSISASIDLFVRETFTRKLRQNDPNDTRESENRDDEGEGGFAIVFLHHPPINAHPCTDCKRFVYTCSSFRSAAISSSDRKRSHSVCPFIAQISIVCKRFAFTMFSITVAHDFISVT